MEKTNELIKFYAFHFILYDWLRNGQSNSFTLTISFEKKALYLRCALDALMGLILSWNPNL